MRLLAVCVLVVGFLAAWLGYLEDSLPADECPAVAATETRYEFQPQVWPPGTRRCDVTTPEGQVLAGGTYFPWADYATVVLLALAVAVFRLRPLRMLASLALFVAGLAVFFIGPQPW